MRAIDAVYILIVPLVAVGCGSNLSRPLETGQAAVGSCESDLVGMIGQTNPPSDSDVIALGERMFNDTRLSSDQTISCSSCHQEVRAFTDGRTRAIGVHGRVGARNSPTIYNTAFSPLLLWDGGASTIEQQIQLALTNPDEMDMTEALIEQRFVEDSDEFVATLGEVPTMAAVAQVTAAYVRTLLAGGTPVDRFLYCGETDTLTLKQRRGLELFSGPANCIRCHVISHESVHPFGGRLALFTDNRFHNIGVGEEPNPGRAAITRLSEDWGAYKTPSLRNVEVTAPYMHDGSLATLKEVVEFYNGGGEPNPNLDPNIRPLGLTDADIDALVEFLQALTSPEVEAIIRERRYLK